MELFCIPPLRVWGNGQGTWAVWLIHGNHISNFSLNVLSSLSGWSIACWILFNSSMILVVSFKPESVKPWLINCYYLDRVFFVVGKKRFCEIEVVKDVAGQTACNENESKHGPSNTVTDYLWSIHLRQDLPGCDRPTWPLFLVARAVISTHARGFSLIAGSRLSCWKFLLTI